MVLLFLAFIVFVVKQQVWKKSHQLKQAGSKMTEQVIEQQENKQKKVSALDWITVITLLLLGGVCLLVWPIVVFGSVFLFDAPGERPPLMIAFVMGIWGYPVVYLASSTYSIWVLKNRPKVMNQPSLYACLPILYVCMLVAMGYAAFL